MPALDSPASHGGVVVSEEANSLAVLAVAGGIADVAGVCCGWHRYRRRRSREDRACWLRCPGCRAAHWQLNPLAGSLPGAAHGKGGGAPGARAALRRGGVQAGGRTERNERYKEQGLHNQKLWGEEGGMRLKGLKGYSSESLLGAGR